MTIQKPWGQEEILYTGEYLVKRLTMRKGECCSIQFHEKKTETIVVISGTLEINHEIVYLPGDYVTILPGVVHQMSAREGDCVYLECSTVYGDEDTTRLEDKYGRV